MIIADTVGEIITLFSFYPDKIVYFNRLTNVEGKVRKEGVSEWLDENCYMAVDSFNCSRNGDEISFYFELSGKECSGE